MIHTLSPEQYFALSKTMSHALRHDPAQYQLVLDAEGWCDLAQLIDVLQRKKSQWSQLHEDDIRAMMADASKQRYEIVGGRIRAIYGHSIKQKIAKRPTDPPDILYHGTRPEVLDLILRDGLKVMNRQYVHLSADINTATLVAKRRTQTPVILTIEARRASADSIQFYRENNGIWLSEPIPASYIIAPS